jgi:hypothetical protein
LLTSMFIRIFDMVFSDGYPSAGNIRKARPFCNT